MSREQMALQSQQLFLLDEKDHAVMRHHTTTSVLKSFAAYFPKMPDELRGQLASLIINRDIQEKEMSKQSGHLPAHLRPAAEPKPMHKKDVIFTLKMANANEGTTTGSVDAQREFLSQCGMTNENMKNQHVIFNGDLGTIRNFQAAQNLVSGYFGGEQPPEPVRDLLCILLRQGFFHTVWNFYRGISRTFWGEKDTDIGSLRFFANLLSRFTKLHDAPIFDKFERFLTDIVEGAMIAPLIVELR
jgi:hypothetical protein